MDSRRLTELCENPTLRRGISLSVDVLARHADLLDAARLRGDPMSGALPEPSNAAGAPLSWSDAVGLALLRVAAVDGSWEPWLQHLQARGVELASNDVDFVAWTSSLQRSMISCIDLAFDEGTLDRAELQALMKGITAIGHTLVEVIGASGAAQVSQVRIAHEALLRLSAPILHAGRQVLLVPLVGDVNGDRVALLLDKLLPEVRALRAKAVVLSLKGVAVVDSAGARQLLRCVEVVRLMGARVVLSGLSTGVAESLVALGEDLPGIDVYTTLEDALSDALIEQRPG